MKKMLVVLLVAVLSLTMCAFAEGIDLTSLSDDELLSLQSQIQNEIAERQLVGGVLNKGRYVVGVDFPAGSYDIYLECQEGNSIRIAIYILPGMNMWMTLLLKKKQEIHVI